MFKRNISNKLEKALKRSPAVLLTGARQTGKTTLVKQIAKDKNYNYITFDDLRFLSAAKNDPIGFISNLSKPVILDEVQRVPEIFLPIKQDIDENRNFGRYILTGSANPLLIPKIAESLAGRIEILELFPLSQGEIIGIKDNFIDTIFSNQNLNTDNLSKTDLYNKILIGGYPTIQNIDEEDRHAWFNSYLTTILQKDVQELSKISAINEFPRLLNLLAIRAGNIINVAEVSRASGLSVTSLHRYITLLETLFLIYFQKPWSSNLSKRLVKSPKLDLIDTGLLSYLVNLNTKNVLENLNLMGNVLENFVLMELYKQATWNQTKVNIYYFRTNTGIEVDILLQDQSNNIIGIEVKSSETITSADFKGLSYLEETIGKKLLKGIVLYPGSQTIPFGKKFYALPISSLWGSN